MKKIYWALILTTSACAAQDEICESNVFEEIEELRQRLSVVEGKLEMNSPREDVFDDFIEIWENENEQYLTLNFWVETVKLSNRFIAKRGPEQTNNPFIDKLAVLVKLIEKNNKKVMSISEVGSGHEQFFYLLPEHCALINLEISLSNKQDKSSLVQLRQMCAEEEKVRDYKRFVEVNSTENFVYNSERSVNIFVYDSNNNEVQRNFLRRGPKYSFTDQGIYIEYGKKVITCAASEQILKATRVSSNRWHLVLTVYGNLVLFDTQGKVQIQTKQTSSLFGQKKPYSVCKPIWKLNLLALGNLPSRPADPRNADVAVLGTNLYTFFSSTLLKFVLNDGNLGEKPKFVSSKLWDDDKVLVKFFPALPGLGQVSGKKVILYNYLSEAQVASTSSLNPLSSFFEGNSQGFRYVIIIFGSIFFIYSKLVYRGSRRRR
eukprot:snap_masked-scaffold_43-processed-gene-0.30-mRNA-1 protein AED:1.00 eAED:1.00 QI:0/0/0/0/1/1/2/0/431